MKHPHIAEINGHKTLIVHDEPFIMLAGEVHNSNSSCLEYMKSVWEQAEMLGMNSLLMPISWELTEPEEGIFDYSLVDGLIAQAREHGMKIGFLWFGSKSPWAPSFAFSCSNATCRSPTPSGVIWLQ